MPTTYLPFERAKRRVEAGDLSFEAIGALTIAHGEKLVRDYDGADVALLAADFTVGSKKRGPTLTLYRISSGRRYDHETIAVSGKREARAIAAERGAKPWNF